MHGRQLGEERSVGSIRAIVDQQPPLTGGDCAVGSHAGGQLDDHAFAPTIRCEEFFAAGEDKFHRPFGCPG